MLPGIAGLSGLSGGSAKVVTYLSLNTDETNGASYTVSGASLGAAASDRYIVIIVSSVSTSGVNSVSSATIGGVSATEVISQSSNPIALAMFIANVPTGTTGDIVANFGATSDYHSIAVWSVSGLDSTTAVDSDGNTTASTGVTMTSLDGGVVIGGIFSADPVAVSWSGASEDYETTIDSGLREISGASGSTMAAGVTLTPTLTGGTDALHFIAATF